MKYFFGFKPFYYYLISFISRASAAILLFSTIKYITKKNLLAFLAASFFAVSYIGIETTDWAFNFVHYAGISAALFFIILYYKLKKNFIYKNLMYAGLAFLFAQIISPPRMHGLLPLVFLIETVWLIIEGKKYNFRKGIVRLGVLLLLYRTLFVSLGDLTLLLREYNIDTSAAYNVYGYGDPGFNIQRVVDGFNLLKSTVQSGRSEIILYPFATIGNYIFPDKLWQIIPFSRLTYFGKPSFTFFTFIFPITLFFGVISWLFFKTLSLRIKGRWLYFVSIAFWMSVVYFFKKTNAGTFSSEYVAYVLIGGFSSIFTAYLFSILKNKHNFLAQLLVLGFGWIITFSIFPLLISPLNVLFAWGRYSIQQAVGVSIWFGAIFYLLIDSLKIKKLYFFIPTGYALVLFFALMHLSFTNSYLAKVGSYRSIEIDRKLWNQIVNNVPELNPDVTSVFYLSSEPKDYLIAEWTLRFKFVGRAALYYQIKDENNNPFMIVNNYQELLSTVTDGDRLLSQGKQKGLIVEIDNIYAFRLDYDKLTDITQEMRDNLRSDVEEYKNSL